MRSFCDSILEGIKPPLTMSKILLIEDEDLMRKIVERILIKEGYQVDIASNGKEAYEKLDSNMFGYDLVITDIMMPYANGFEILSKIKTSEKGKDVPVIVVSSVGNEDMVMEGFKLGADDFLKKPIMAGELLIRINRLLSRGKQ